MQVFTAAAYLCLSCIRQRQNSEMPSESRMAFVEQIVDTMDYAGDQMGGDFVRDAASAIRSLLALVKDPNGDPGGPQTLTLRIPLLGRIRIGRKKLREGKSSSQANVQRGIAVPMALTSTSQQSGFTDPVREAALEQQAAGQFNMDVANTLPWLMELDMNASSLQDPFLHEDFHEFDQWLGMNNNPYGVM